MRVLAVDIGTGTQDALLFDSAEPIENAVQMVLPSPTLVIARRIRAATAAGAAIALDGTIMGGGPCAWATEDHLRAGYPVCATPDAARTFDDDLTRVAEMGVRLRPGGDSRRAGGFRRGPAGGCALRGGVRPRQCAAGL